MTSKSKFILFFTVKNNDKILIANVSQLALGNADVNILAQDK